MSHNVFVQPDNINITFFQMEQWSNGINSFPICDGNKTSLLSGNNITFKTVTVCSAR